ncbi:protein of unknown function UPF0044 [Pyrolobus fumarii 1A]|uniref:CRM domain-containing protein n=1 Tax=Pyrolobus fumarii (strain DSM 11204 / 1A) TaxID=694429 RepID=G0EE46_PYRF1|nr:protein of unknown function UPF0044 [Pyrolobus fumarii 1A]
MRVDLKRLKEIVQQGPADVIIGKNGLSEGVIREIDRRLKEKGVIKVKALRSAIAVTGLDRKTLARRVAELVNARLLDVRGRTFVLFRYEDYVRAHGGGETPNSGYKARGVSGGERAGRRWSQRLRYPRTS